MAKASARPNSAAPRRLPRGRHALTPEEVVRDQRERLLDAVPRVLAERGYEAASVADLVKAAAVSRNAFYENFADKRECVSIAHELGHERLFEVLTALCEGAGESPEEGACDEAPRLEERVERSLRAGLEALAAEPELARLLFVEAPSAGEGIALRYHEWLQRYGSLLRVAAPDLPPESIPAPEVEGVIVGGIASRIASEVLQGRAAELPVLSEPFVKYVLAFYRLGESPEREGQVLSFEAEAPAADAAERRASA